ncbi:MAG: 23S rRNA (uracil(1939)-C(5))-methyltransferase RlmD [Bacteroidales bacterium]
MRGKKTNIILENIAVTDLAAEGKAIARVENQVVFITGAIPGDIVNVRVLRKKKNFMEGTIEKLVKPSSDRVIPVCEHFGICGGCTWQQLPYEKQLLYKEKQVRDQLERIGKIDGSLVKPILGSKRPYNYRNKLEYTFSSKRWFTKEEIGSGEAISDVQGLGFHIPGKFDKVLDIKTCHLQPEPSNAIRLAVRSYCLEHQLPFFDIVNQTGFLRNLIIRNNLQGEFMVIISFFYDDPPLRDGLLLSLANQFPEITSLLFVINPKGNDTIHDRDVQVFKGNDYLPEGMEDLTFRISPKSFFQTNTEQAGALYDITRRMANLGGNETVYDLYTGTGTIALFMARHCRKVVAVEYVPEAIADARINAGLNAIENARFFAGDMKEVLTPEFIAREGRPDVVILDPPRAGVHPDVLARILEASPQRIVYVSCNPGTQARDLGILAAGYHVAEVQPVDMFPHTMHVENVALLLRNQFSSNI